MDIEHPSSMRGERRGEEKKRRARKENVGLGERRVGLGKGGLERMGAEGACLLIHSTYLYWGLSLQHLDLGRQSYPNR